MQESPSMLTRLITLAAYTVLPLAGVLLLGWDWREIVLLYWLENISLGVATVIRMLRSAEAPGGARADAPSGDGAEHVGAEHVVAEHLVEQRVKARPPRDNGDASSLASFFALHYGIFTLVHGVFVVLLVMGAFVPTPAPETPLNWVSALIVWVIGGTAQVLAARFGPPPEQTAPRLMLSAYGRMIVLHVSLIVDIALIATFDWPPVAAIFLIGLHALVNAAGWTIATARDRAARDRAARRLPRP